MKKLLITFITTCLMLTGCGSNSASPPQNVETEPVQAQPISPTTATEDAPKQTDKQETPDEDHPLGHLYLEGYEKLYIYVDRVRYVSDAFDTMYLVFDLTVRNGTDKSLSVSDLSFALITKNKEILEWEPGSPAETRSVTLVSGGTAAASVGFRADLGEVDELMYGNNGEAVYRITAFPAIEGYQDDSTTTEAVEEVPAGSGVKADSYLYEELYLNYENSLIDAINNGDFSLVEHMLFPDSNLYKSQKQLVENLSKQGTKEELVEFEIQEAMFDETSGTVFLTVREKVKIIKASGESVSDNTWKYTIQQAESGMFQFSDISKP